MPKQPFGGAERRAGRRAKLIVQVDCRGKHAVSLGNSLDISETGLLIATPEMLPPETEVTLRFALPVPPQAMAIETKAIVVRSINGQMAVRFLGLHEAERRAIRRYAETQG